MEFPNLGEHCSERTCNRLDFLPFKCDACEATFCTDHISYASHSCPSAYKKDTQVAVCPLCNVPIPTKRGEPPDITVGMHMDRDCQSDFLQKQKIFTNKCSSKGCKVKEIVPVRCSECGENFCIRHRHPTDHACVMKEEATRRKRLEALNRQAKNKDAKTNGGTSSVVIRNLQGTMSEDQAYATAIQASLLDEATNRRQRPQPVLSGSADRCRLS